MVRNLYPVPYVSVGVQMQQQLTLQKAGLLYRRWEFQGPDGTYTLEYNGKGMGYESVRINGRETLRLPSYSWFVPRFDFPLQGRDTSLLVEINPWLSIRSLAIYQGDHCLYSEGRRLHSGEYGPTPTNVAYDKDGLIDQGPCLIYYQLSYRRRIIRSLWGILFSLPILLLPHLIGFPQSLAVYLFVFTIVGSLLQALWNYLIFRNRR
jgi:hypothetical protein